MPTIAKNSFWLFVIFLFSVTLTGCATMQTYAEYGDLDVRAATVKPIFLRQEGKKLFVRVDCPVLEWKGMEANITKGFEGKGYQLVPESVQADIILDIQIRSGQMEKHSARAVQGRDHTSGGGALAGAGAGYIISSGDPLSSVAGAVGGLVVGGLVDVTLNSWAHLGVLEARADILALENAGKAPKTKEADNATMWRETETAVIVKAKQAGMKWEDAAPKIEESMAAQIVSILPKK